MAKKRILKKVKKEISNYLDVLKQDRLPIREVWLFGSYAKGNPHEWSDIDLCIVSPKFKDPFRAMQYLWLKRIKDNGLTIEPVGYSQKDFAEGSSLISEIKQHGIKIKI
ncbi:nucleotidyltransferase [Candidatus Kuenenbacteria bacterium CG08_land_8_20_14_0_20_37_23]|uniref:Nucleotidyltransferase n=1 Tax=Candidatus Kuenenbacteria bacterium CG08_land_8_20_14_0_20_37_23 TaxID=1974617 RepID=A0A2M6XT72_9BACT|nr:MAG: nucleotidyltransferase [Candidatus Kuenenbacteria bacterium CG08_land_8_20_14_0_20_37_23]